MRRTNDYLSESCQLANMVYWMVQLGVIKIPVPHNWNFRQAKNFPYFEGYSKLDPMPVEETSPATFGIDGHDVHKRRIVRFWAGRLPLAEVLLVGYEELRDRRVVGKAWQIGAVRYHPVLVKHADDYRLMAEYEQELREEGYLILGGETLESPEVGYNLRYFGDWVEVDQAELEPLRPERRYENEFPKAIWPEE